MNKLYVYLVLGLLAGLVAISLFLFFTRQTSATYQLPNVNICHCPDGNPLNCSTKNISLPAALAHLNNHENDYRGVCEEVVDVCPEEGVQPTGPCEEPKDYCDTLEGVQAEDEDCPKEEDPTPTPTEVPQPGGWSPEPEGNRKPGPPGVCTGEFIGNVANINVVSTGNKGELEVQWALPSNANQVHIEYGLEQNAQHSLLNTPNDGNEVIRNLVSGKHYWFRVAGVDGCSVGNWSRWFDPIVP